MEVLEETQQQGVVQPMVLRELVLLQEQLEPMVLVQRQVVRALRVVQEQQHRVKPLLIMLIAMLIL